MGIGASSSLPLGFPAQASLLIPFSAVGAWASPLQDPPSASGTPLVTPGPFLPSSLENLIPGALQDPNEDTSLL